MHNISRNITKIFSVGLMVFAAIFAESTLVIVLIKLRVPAIIFMLVSIIGFILFIYLGYAGYIALMESYDERQRQDAEFNKKHPLLTYTKKDNYPLTETETMVGAVSRLWIWYVYLIVEALGTWGLWAIFRKFELPMWVFCTIIIFFFVIPFITFSILIYRRWKNRNKQDGNQN
jgi:magnesium-transporting ATPase (P-type)